MSFRDYPEEKKRKIAKIITIAVAVVLVVLLVLIYTVPQFTVARRPGLFEQVRGVYTTVIDRAQSYFTNK